MEKRTCIRCAEEKDIDAFPMNSSTVKGRVYKYPRTVCKKCENKRRDERRKRNGISESRKISKYQKTKEWHEINKERVAIRKKDKYYIYKYGLTEEQYTSMYNEQNGCCKICNKQELEDSVKSNKLYVDHCHETGKVRGLICHHCNTGLGNFKDNIEILENAIVYLKNN